MYGRSIYAITFDLNGLQRLVSWTLRLWRLISRKGTELGHILLISNYVGDHIFGVKWHYYI